MDFEEDVYDDKSEISDISQGEEERESSSASLKSPYKITSEDADELLGKDVKSFSESPEQIMRLLKVLDL